MHPIDTREYVSTLRELVREGKTVNMLVSGQSMSPFVCHYRDYVYFKAPWRPLRRGDIVFFQRDDGRFILHRILRVRRGTDGQPLYDIVGDNQTEIERGVRADQIFALVCEVKRKGKRIKPGDFWWWFFERVWLRVIPLRRFLVRVYGRLFGR